MKRNSIAPVTSDGDAEKSDAAPKGFLRENFFTKKCLAAACLFLAFIVGAAMVFWRIPQTMVKDIDPYSIFISDDFMYGPGITTIFNDVRRNISNAQIGSQEWTMNLRLSHPVKNDAPHHRPLRMLSEAVPIDGGDAGKSVNATIHATTMPEDQVPPGVERVDLDDPDAEVGLGVVSQAEPETLKRMKCSLKKAECKVNGTIENYDESRRLLSSAEARRTCGAWAPKAVAAVACNLICNWVAQTVYRFLCGLVQDTICNGGSIQNKLKCYEAIEWTVCNRDWKSKSEGKTKLRLRFAEKGFPKGDYDFYLRMINGLGDDHFKIAKVVIQECVSVCTVIVVIIWYFIASCFPGSALVITPSGPMPISHTAPGMPVLTPDGSFKDIYFMGHADQHENSYVVLHTASGHKLTLSGDHFVFADEEYRFAKNVQLGQRVPIFNASDSAVTSIEFALLPGAYNPYVVGGQLIVDMAVHSCHSSWLLEGIISEKYLPYIYEKLMYPLVMIYRFKPKAMKAFHEMYIDNGAVSDHSLVKIMKDAVCALLV